MSLEAKREALLQRIVVVEAKARFAGLMSAAADLDDHRFAPADSRRLAHDAAAEDIAGAALEQALIARPRLVARHLQGHAGGDAAAGRAAIDLPAGEDADVATRLAARSVATVGQDGAIEEGEIGFVAMLDRHGFRRRLSDLLA